jgi:hypothetical protein
VFSSLLVSAAVGEDVDAGLEPEPDPEPGLVPWAKLAVGRPSTTTRKSANFILALQSGEHTLINARLKENLVCGLLLFKHPFQASLATLGLVTNLSVVKYGTKWELLKLLKLMDST